MSNKYSEAISPFYGNGSHVLIDTLRTSPDKGMTRAIVLFTKFDNMEKENMCFLQPYAWQSPSTKEWKAYIAVKNMIRPEATILSPV